MYGSVGQAEVYRSQLKIRRRKKGESLTDLAQDIRKLMSLAYLGPQDRTTEALALDSFLEALEDPEFTVQVQAQNPRNLDGALRIAQRMEAVFQTVHSRISKPVPAVSEAMAGQEVQVSEKDPWVEQLAKAVQQLNQQLSQLKARGPEEVAIVSNHGQAGSPAGSIDSARVGSGRFSQAGPDTRSVIF